MFYDLDTYFLRVDCIELYSVVDAQTQLSIASEKERSVQEREMTLQNRVGVLEARLGSLRQEKSQLVASLELEKTKLQSLKEEQQR